MTYSRTWRLMRLTVLSFLLGSSVVSAQSESTTSAFSAAASFTASSTSGSPITHTVDVALGGFTFVPDVVLAEVGDYIEYVFYPTNHSVVRSNYGFPCIPYEDIGVDKIGFFSGFMPVDTIIANPPTFTIRVNDTDPIFYYCSAPGSCINYAMVGVINPTANETLAVQKQLAKNSTFMLEPGQAWPSESTSTSTATSTSTTSSSSSSSTTTTPTASPTASLTPPITNHSSSLSGGAIGGIVIGAAAVAIIAAALLYLCGRQSRRTPHESIPQHPQVAYVAPNPLASKHSTIVGHDGGAFGGSPYTSPALPGYVAMHDPASSPPMRPYYAPSDALSPAGDSEEIRTPSPGQMMRGVGVPPYTSMVQPQQNTENNQVNSSGPVHEMDAPAQEQGGFFNLIRNASTRKSGGVERYT